MDVAWLKERKKALGITDVAFAEALGVERSVANKVANGKVALNARRIDAVAALFGVSSQEMMYRAGLSANQPDASGSKLNTKISSAVHPDQQPTRSADGGETASVMRMDLSYALGPGTNIDDDYVEGEPVELDIGFLRRLTPSSPDKLRIVSGIGDSMFPTIHDSEDLILDLGQRVLNLQDRIWALSLDGVGAVKRLQTIGKGRILVISDNPDVPNREASIEDIVIVGRLVGSVRRH